MTFIVNIVYILCCLRGLYDASQVPPHSKASFAFTYYVYLAGRSSNGSNGASVVCTQPSEDEKKNVMGRYTMSMAKQAQIPPGCENDPDLTLLGASEVVMTWVGVPSVLHFRTRRALPSCIPSACHTQPSCTRT